MIFSDVNHSMIVIWKITMLAQLSAKELFVTLIAVFKVYYWWQKLHLLTIKFWIWTWLIKLSCDYLTNLVKDFPMLLIIAEGNDRGQVTTTNIHASLGKLCILNSSPFGQHLFPRTFWSLLDVCCWTLPLSCQNFNDNKIVVKIFIFPSPLLHRLELQQVSLTTP